MFNDGQQVKEKIKLNNNKSYFEKLVKKPQPRAEQGFNQTTKQFELFLAIKRVLQNILQKLSYL